MALTRRKSDDVWSLRLAKERVTLSEVVGRTLVGVT